MKKMISLIIDMPSDNYKDFCLWLVECCGMSISELIEKNDTYQRRAVEQWQEERCMFNPY